MKKRSPAETPSGPVVFTSDELKRIEPKVVRLRDALAARESAEHEYHRRDMFLQLVIEDILTSRGMPEPAARLAAISVDALSGELSVLLP